MGLLGVRPNRNSLHDVSRDLAFAPVVEPRGPRGGVPSQVLHVLERYALVEEVRDRGGPKRMARELAVGDPHAVTGQVEPGHQGRVRTGQLRGWFYTS